MIYIIQNNCTISFMAHIWACAQTRLCQPYPSGGVWERAAHSRTTHIL
jgi:hypothetical protein